MSNGFGQDAEIYSVSELNRAAKSLLEGQFPAVFVEGEISNFSRPASGHWYFTLKDDAGQLRTAMFRNRNSRINFTPTNGLKVLVRGRISLYEARGDFQFIAENMQEAGIGELQRHGVPALDPSSTRLFKRSVSAAIDSPTTIYSAPRKNSSF